MNEETSVGTIWIERGVWIENWATHLYNFFQPLKFDVTNEKKILSYTHVSVINTYLYAERLKVNYFCESLIS